MTPSLIMQFSRIHYTTFFNRVVVLETVWRSQSLNLETKLRLFDSLVLSVMLYGAESWPTSTQMNQLINSCATSAYRIMTGVNNNNNNTDNF